MDAHAKQNCVAVLERLRDVHQGQLDTSVIAEINEVIAALKNDDCDCFGPEAIEDWRYRALKVIGDVVRLVTNISNLMTD